MKKGISLLLLAILLLGIVGCSANEDISAQEMQGSHVSAAKEKEVSTEEVESNHRIVSLSVAVTEILDALELDLIGIPTSYKELPERYAEVQEMGGAKSPDMELLLTLNPTEVFSVKSLEYDLTPMFAEVGLNISFLDLESLAAMKNEIIALGDKYDRQEQAAALVAKFEEKEAEIEKEIEGKEAPSVLILLGVPGSYLVATEHSYIGDLVKIAGGKNVVQGESVEYLASNTEYLYQSNPDVILRLAHGMPEEVIDMFDKEFRQNDIWKHFDAVKNDRVYDLEELLFPTTGTVRADEALDELMKLLY